MAGDQAGGRGKKRAGVARSAPPTDAQSVVLDVFKVSMALMALGWMRHQSGTSLLQNGAAGAGKCY